MVKLRQIDEYRWEIPREGKMRTRGLIFASKEMLPEIQGDQSLQQVANVATLPGIVGPLPGHARHPLGLRLRHRRGGGLRPGGGGHFPRRRGL